MDPTRRGLLGSFGILAAARGPTGADPHKSLEFDQGLFGLPVQARQGDSTILRIGNGPRTLSDFGTSKSYVRLRREDRGGARGGGAGYLGEECPVPA